MAEYIEREALLEDIENTLVFSGRPDRESPKQMGARMVVQRIRAAQAADVAHVVHGRWIPIEIPTGIELLGIKETVVGFIRCSKCNMEFDISCEWYSKYCPNCGARMDGE